MQTFLTHPNRDVLTSGLRMLVIILLIRL